MAASLLVLDVMYHVRGCRAEDPAGVLLQMSRSGICRSIGRISLIGLIGLISLIGTPEVEFKQLLLRVGFRRLNESGGEKCFGGYEFFA